MTENGPALADRFTREADRTPWMASRPGEPADDATTDLAVVAWAIVVLLVIFAMSWRGPV
jgi:hypothetical protein